MKAGKLTILTPEKMKSSQNTQRRLDFIYRLILSHSSMSDLDIKIKKESPTRRKANIKVPASRVKKELENLVAHYARQARLDGFRKGKAPPSLVAERYRDALHQELKEKILSEVYEELKEKEHLDICTIVDLEGIEHLETSLKDSKDLSLVYVLDIRPDFDLPSYEKFVLELPDPEPTQEEIEKTKEMYLMQRANYKEVERPANKGDYVKLSYQGLYNEKPIDDLVKETPIYGTQTNTWEKAGDTESPGVKAIVEGIIGLKKGDQNTFEERFPKKGSPVVALSGKTITYTVDIHEIREAELPSLDEAFLKQEGVKTADEWIERIKEGLCHQKKAYIEDVKRQKILDTLLEKVKKIPLPQSLVDHEKEGVMKQLDKKPDASSNKKQLAKEALELAERRICSDLLINAIAEKENIVVTQQDLQKIILTEASYLRIPPQEFVKQLKSHPEQVKALRYRALFQKTLEFLSSRVEAA